ncbi:hypothetical protein FRC11_001665, partial [Ceratobasidium sp. 423]
MAQPYSVHSHPNRLKRGNNTRKPIQAIHARSNMQKFAWSGLAYCGSLARVQNSQHRSFFMRP